MITCDLNKTIVDALGKFNDPMGYVLLAALALCSLWYTLRTRGAQFRLFPEMCRLLFESNKKEGKQISSFQAFAVSIASRVGTGNLAGVATAIYLGGPGAVFWMWVMALLGSANAFVESTLAQLFKIKGKDSFIGGPAYYITKGLHKKWFAYIFALAIIADFGLTNNMVQSNTISIAFNSAFGITTNWMAIGLTTLTLLIIFGGIQRIAKVSSVIVPVMAIAYLILAIYVIVTNFQSIPRVLDMIFTNAFGFNQFMGGGVGTAVVIGFKRGLFSNEAGEGSAPNAAATADVSHPVKQGLIQALGVYTDTLLVCSCTAFIILCSGVFNNGQTGIELTQTALTSEIGPIGATFIAITIFLFAFTSVIGNYYYGESNLYFMSQKKSTMFTYRVAVGALVLIGALVKVDLAWAFVDVFMAIMTICNLIAIMLLGKYAVKALRDYDKQRKAGKNPEYHKSTIPEIANETECWEE
jgi:AGCS family alanine or glycine:cation symporter